eukprot:2713431-Lingulodinium_polyedra.AAC.1
MDTLVALDNLLQRTTGAGVSQFLPNQVRGRELWAMGNLPRTLVMCMDEGSPGYAMVWWGLYKAHLRLLPLRDVFHREWNDTLDAVKGAGLFW